MYVCTHICMYIYYICVYVHIYYTCVHMYVHRTNVHLVQILVQSTQACSSASCTNYINTGDAATYIKKNINFNQYFILNWHLVITQNTCLILRELLNPSECCFITPNVCMTLLNSQLGGLKQIYKIPTQSSIYTCNSCYINRAYNTILC